MLKAYRIENERIVEAPDQTAPILIYVNPDETERRFLVDSLKIDEHTLQSSLDPDEMARLEFEPSHVALVLKRPQSYSAKDQLQFKASTMGLFYFADRLVIVLSDDIYLFEGRVFQKVLSLADVLLKLIFRAIVHFLEHLKVINMISDSLEQKVQKEMDNKNLLNLFSLEKSLVYYLSAINTNGVLVERLKVSAAKVGFSPEQLELLDDIIIENIQCYKQAEIYSNILASMMNARASIVSNNLNIMMKNLNSLVIAVAVPSLLAGIGGMSEFSMMTGAKNWPLTYFLFFVCIIGLGVGTFFSVRYLEKYWR
jgi:magnesium transporter